MPPEASSRPEIGLNFIDTSTSVYGPGGATITLNSFLVARCTSTFLPLGAPAMSSTAHWPSTVVHPSMPLVSKSKRSTGMFSGNLISAGAARARACRLRLKAAAAANPALTRPRRDPVASCIATLVQLLGHGLPLAVPDERHVRH